MKKNLTVLVLLVAWSLLFIPSLSSVAIAGGTLEDPGSTDDPSSTDPIVQVNGASDDDSEGDPGDAGDGYGVDDSLDPGDFGGYDGMDDSILDELMLILMSLSQLAL